MDVGRLHEILQRLERESIHRDETVQREALERDKAIEKLNQKRFQQLVDQVQANKKQLAASGQESLMEKQKELFRVVAQVHGNYSNVIMLGGYAGLFALLSLTRELVGPVIFLIAAISTGISILLFVLFEMIKAFRSTRYIKEMVLIAESYSLSDVDRVSLWRELAFEFDIDAQQ